MTIHRISYWVYSFARAALRFTGTLKLVRPLAGAAAARFVYQTSSNGSEPLNIKGHAMILAPPGSYASPDMVNDRYEVGTTRLFEQLIRPDEIIIDVGAHVGYFTLLAAKLVGPSGKVFAFEPEPMNYALLTKNIGLNNYANISAQPVAVSNHCGSSQLYMSPLDNGLHSLNRLGSPDQTYENQKTVDTTTLDAFLEQQGWPQIALVKIDIEGSETAAFEGMSQFFIREQNTKLILELCPWILETMGVGTASFLGDIRSRGFEIHVIEPNRLTKLKLSNQDPIIENLSRNAGYINIFCTRA